MYRESTACLVRRGFDVMEEACNLLASCSWDAGGSYKVRRSTSTGSTVAAGGALREFDTAPCLEGVSGGSDMSPPEGPQASLGRDTTALFARSGAYS